MQKPAMKANSTGMDIALPTSALSDKDEYEISFCFLAHSASTE